MKGGAARKPDDDNVVCIGKKGVMPYVLAVVTQFRSGAREVCVKARGNAISCAVDVAEVARARFVPGARQKSVVVGSEEMRRSDGTSSRVSFIEITLALD